MKLTQQANIEQALAHHEVYVLDKSIAKSCYMPIDLSPKNVALKSLDITNANEMQRYIERQLALNNKQVAFGGYVENRELYNRSKHFGSGSEARNIHLGVDLWCDAETQVLAAVNGRVHSFRNNMNYGDYGPTIILEHQIKSFTIYSLYGHLSLDSLRNISVGQQVFGGEVIGALGGKEVNGDYAPHLHFQLILDLDGKEGDYPGVCSEKELLHYQKNCPDPSVLLGLIL